MTSHDAVFKLRKILQEKKIGHGGTLDPDVTGVLPIAVGKATRVIEYMTEAGGSQYVGGIAGSSQGESRRDCSRGSSCGRVATATCTTITSTRCWSS